jgi:hypothetical protein
MMPAQGRSPAPSLPPVDDEATVPFSDLIKSGFDTVTVDSTTQLADQSIFVASNGIRYRFERIPDSAPAPGRVPTSGQVPPPVAQPVSYSTQRPTYSRLSASLPPPQLHVHAPDNAPGWRRSPSSASTHSFSSGAYSVRSGQAGAVVPGPAPRSAAHEITDMMAHVSISPFGARPLYGLSDGGAQAAETLTDPDLASRAPPMSPTSHTGFSTSPRIPYAQQQQPPPPPQYQEPDDDPSPGHISQPWTLNYSDYTAQSYALLQQSREEAKAVRGYPSLLEGATPLMPSHRASDPVSVVSPLSPDPEAWTTKEVWDGQGAGGGYYYYPPHPHPSVSAPPSLEGRRSTTYVNCGPGDIDTQTPVVVPQPTPSTTSDGASTGRDNELPSEVISFNGPVKSTQSLAVPVFRDGVLKVFRNTITNDLRFYCKVDHESETFWSRTPLLHCK